MTEMRLCTQLSLDDFLCIDGLTGVTVLPDDTRRNFFRHLGLQEHNYRHRLLYRRMKQEARVAMQRLFDTRDSLRPELIDDETVTVPYRLDQIAETAFQVQVEEIYRTASRQTRGIYDLTNTGDGRHWVIRWMLWRIVRQSEGQDYQATSSGAESDYSMLSTCSTATDYPSVRTDHLSPPWSSPLWMPSRLTPHDYSDSEDWEEPPPKAIKLDPDDRVFIKPAMPTPKTAYWDHVMGNT
ncbi:Hypothetical predicted protein [Lecanosticta acicola]|uniref:Uncharacterized protein n=1 Tax=Lecanosticta acicola TaxID=111012 RepID=A0AAI8YZA6_9PEZI|nr:Hypothetical predicted protein [Lecanosticta acicola]